MQLSALTSVGDNLCMMRLRALHPSARSGLLTILRTYHRRQPARRPSFPANAYRVSSHHAMLRSHAFSAYSILGILTDEGANAVVKCEQERLIMA